MKKELIIKKSPLVGYLEDAYALTVALTCESSYEWIYSNYIQLMYQPPLLFDNQPLKFFKLSFVNGIIWDAECPLLCYDKIPLDIVEATEVDIIKIIRAAVINGYYVKVFLDEYYLPYRSVYNEVHFVHESLFFGFDDDKNELKGLAYVTDKTGYHFKSVSVDMDAVRKGFAANKEKSVSFERVVLLSCNPERYYEFDIEVVKRSLYEYLMSVKSSIKYSEINNTNNYAVFGINIYDELIAYYDQDEKFTNITPLHIVYEHKKMMLDRVEFMIENGYISDDQSIICDYKNLLEMAHMSKMLYLKSKLSHNGSIRERLLNILGQLKRRDTEASSRLLAFLNERRDPLWRGTLFSRWGWWRDVAYSLPGNRYGEVKVSFKLHIFNYKSRGYVRVTNEDCLRNYYSPFIFRIDSNKLTFGISDSCDQNLAILNEIQCKSGNEYSVDFNINLITRIYRITVKCQNQASSFKSQYSEALSQYLGYINYLAVIHENSYRFAISDLRY